jgi:hypothetical protein
MSTAAQSSTVMEAIEEHDNPSGNESQSSGRQTFSLRAFSEMHDTNNSSILPQDLYKNPQSVVELENGAQHTSDDSVITRLTMGKMAAFEANQLSTTTTVRR